MNDLLYGAETVAQNLLSIADDVSTDNPFIGTEIRSAALLIKALAAQIEVLRLQAVNPVLHFDTRAELADHILMMAEKWKAWEE